MITKTHRIENPSVGGSIPHLKTTPELCIPTCEILLKGCWLVPTPLLLIKLSRNTLHFGLLAADGSFAPLPICENLVSSSGMWSLNTNCGHIRRYRAKERPTLISQTRVLELKMGFQSSALYPIMCSRNQHSIFCEPPAPWIPRIYLAFWFLMPANIEGEIPTKESGAVVR